MKVTEIRTYDKQQVIAFKSTKAKHGGLSNMAGGFSLRVNDIIIPSAEALYQACRFPLFPDIQQQIIDQNSPMTAKMISRKNIQYTRQDWEEVKYSIMYWVLQVKLSQNFKNFSNVLHKTNHLPIVELSDKDKDWAVVEIGQNNLSGKNALGRLLMKLRDEYIFKNQFIEVVNPLNIFGFLLYGSEIEHVYNVDVETEQNLLFDLDYV